MVQLRGLPYRATEEDILAFLQDHANNLDRQDPLRNPIELIRNKDGRPSGFARLLFSRQLVLQSSRQ